MIDRIIGKLPEAWRGLAELAAAPIAWVPVLQQTLMSFFFEPQPGWMAAMKYVFLLFPALLRVVGRRAGRVAVLGRHGPYRRRGAGLVPRHLTAGRPTRHRVHPGYRGDAV